MTLDVGIHDGIPAEVYHADPAPAPSLSSSIGKLLIQKAPLHAWFSHPRLNPAFERPGNKVMDAGTVAHQVLLHGNEDGMVVIDADSWRTKLAQEVRDAAWAAGKTPLLAHQLLGIHAMVKAAREYVALSELAGIFERGKPEQTVIWKEGDNWCRCRPDFWTDDHSIMIDYKSTATNAEPNTFVRQMMSMGYDFQGAFYRRGAFEVARELPDFIFLVQENTPPYACSLIGMAEPMLDLAERKVQYAIDQWAIHMQSRKWSGYPRRIAYAEPPEYAVRSFEELIDQGGQA